MRAWALEGAANPTVLRLHVRHELTTATIVTCPPSTAPAPLSGLVELNGVRSLDLHRYLVRINLRRDVDRAVVTSSVVTLLRAAWGDPAAVPLDEGPRLVQVERTAARRVAESPEMAAGDPHLVAAFGVEGVAEAVGGHGMVLVRLGRLFRWDDVASEVDAALASAPNPPSRPDRLRKEPT